MKIILCIIGVVFFILFWLVSNNIERINDMEGIVKSLFTVLSIIFGIFVFDLFVSLPYYLFTYSIMQEGSFKRTEKGEEINIKLEGLKKYLSEYTLLKEKDGEAIEL